MRRVELEVCVDTAAGLSTCLQAGVDRVELCSALALGGLTPAYGFMKLAGRLSASLAPSGTVCADHEVDTVTDSVARPQVLAMIRPRSGNFCFSALETDSMCDDIAAARDAGLDGVVLGAATAAGALDLSVLRRLCQTACGLQLCLHRVIDLLEDPLLAIDQAVELGFTRILTSGGAVSVTAGLPRLSRMKRHAGNRIQIMAGAGLSPTLAKRIQADIGIEAFHASCRGQVVVDQVLDAFGFAGAHGEPDVDLINEYRLALADAAEG